MPGQNGAFSPDGARIYTTLQGDWQGIAIWDAATGHRLARVRVQEPIIKPIDVAPDGERMLLLHPGHTSVLTLASDLSDVSVRRIRGQGGRLESAVFSPDGRSIAIAAQAQGGRAVIFAADTLRQRLVLEKGRNDAAFSADGRRIVVADSDDFDGRDSAVRVIDLATGREEFAFRANELGPNDGPLQARIAPNGRHIAAASRDYLVHVADGATGEVLRRLRGHGRWVESVAFSPDSRMIASAAHDGTARLWETETGLELAVLPHDDNAVVHAVFAPSGEKLLTCSLRRGCKLWALAAP